MTKTKRPRGRPPRIARDVALLCAVEWFKRREHLATVAATRAVRELWRDHGRKGLGDPASDSPVVFERMRSAMEQVGGGTFQFSPGTAAGGKLRDAVVYYVVAGSTFRDSPEPHESDSIVGACWRWPFPAEEAEFLSDNSEFPSVGDGRAGTPPFSSLGSGPGR